MDTQIEPGLSAGGEGRKPVQGVREGNEVLRYKRTLRNNAPRCLRGGRRTVTGERGSPVSIQGR